MPTSYNTSNLPPPTPPAPSYRSHRSGNNESQSHHSTSRDRRHRSPIPYQREKSSLSESRSSSKTPEIEGKEVKRRGRSPRQNDQVPRHREESTTQKIRYLDAKIDAINTGASTPITIDSLIKQTDPPFTERIMRTRVSSKFKLPTQLRAYVGRTDPMYHLHSYKSLMSLHGYSNEVMCKAFPATIKGSARTWFRKLPLGTIDSFGNLSKLFVANFISCRDRQKNASHPFIVHQKEAKSLKDYIKRFNQAVLEVEYPSDKIVIMAMMEGLRPGPLFDSLSKKIPATLSTLQSKDDKCITAEELVEAKRRRRRKDDHKRKGSPRHPMRSTH
ncbi:hypothetical protein Acr_00g0026170 [Actinidia rufa]|uniref:Retrotransposon gag domain-containing protein n=1 Tax=Actinidia rufa TaxID=165716 RepID=A0A7J0DE70_9ERIC|nr:hypothetical protein Acr_00g0026170 [Actinidia rufa]